MRAKIGLHMRVVFVLAEIAARVELVLLGVLHILFDLLELGILVGQHLLALESSRWLALVLLVDS